MSALPSGTVTFLFTDVEGSTKLLRSLRDRYRELLSDHRKLVRAALSEHRGHEVDTQGEGFLVVFHRAKDAVGAAVRAQLDHSRHQWPDDAEVRIRMALHTAEPDSFGEGYFGLGVHRGARICAVGHGGQVLLSRSTAGLVDEDELPGIRLRDLGEHRLKDLERPERIYQLVAEGLPSEFPPLRSLSEAARATEHASLPTGTSTFLATDIVSSVGILRRFGRELYADMLELYERALRDVFTAAGGYKVDVVGDSFLVVFERAGDAVRAALDGKRALDVADWPECGRPQVCFGVHTGEATRRRARYVGIALIRALRVCEAAMPGQILLSQATENVLDEDDVRGLHFEDLGPREVKDFDRPVRLYEVQGPDGSSAA